MEGLEGDECDDGCADRRAGAARTCKLIHMCQTSGRSWDASDTNGPRKVANSNCKQRRIRRQESSKFLYTHEGDAATGGGAPCARGRHAMEPERRRHQFQPLRALRARAPLQAGPGNTTQESSALRRNLTAARPRGPPPTTTPPP